MTRRSDSGIAGSWRGYKAMYPSFVPFYRTGSWLCGSRARSQQDG
jgi:hypothetical protein